MRRSAATRIATAFLLVLFVEAHPAVLCAVDCVLQRHGVVHQAHAGHHTPANDQPCHTGQVTSGTTVPAMPLAVAIAPSSLAIDVITGPETTFDATHPATTPRTVTLPQDTPPPRA